MNRQWSDIRPQYKCGHCGRIVFVSSNYLPAHCPPRKRIRCDGSGEHTVNHKKVD